MSERLAPPRPDDVMVIRDLTPNVTTFSVPFSRFGVAKIGGRGTVGMDYFLSLLSSSSPLATRLLNG